MPTKNEPFAWVDGVEDMPADAKQEFADAVKTADGGKQMTVQIAGDADRVLKVLTALKAGTKQTELITQFDKTVKLTANTTNVTYDMIWLIDQVAKGRDIPDPQKVLDKMRGSRFGLVFSQFIDKVQVKAETDADIEQTKNPDMSPKQVQSFIEGKKMAGIANIKLADIVKGMEKMKNGEQAQFVESEPVLETAPAKRRMKLFEDAEYYGAEIIKTSKWIAAICRGYDQVHTFGRLKPKVEPGTNKIDPACNLRLDEGITPENLKK